MTHKTYIQSFDINECNANSNNASPDDYLLTWMKNFEEKDVDAKKCRETINSDSASELEKGAAKTRLAFEYYYLFRFLTKNTAIQKEHLKKPFSFCFAEQDKLINEVINLKHKDIYTANIRYDALSIQSILIENKHYDEKELDERLNLRKIIEVGQYIFSNSKNDDRKLQAQELEKFTDKMIVIAGKSKDSHLQWEMETLKSYYQEQIKILEKQNSSQYIKELLKIINKPESIPSAKNKANLTLAHYYFDKSKFALDNKGRHKAYLDKSAEHLKDIVALPLTDIQTAKDVIEAYILLGAIAIQKLLRAEKYEFNNDQPEYTTEVLTATYTQQLDVHKKCIAALEYILAETNSPFDQFYANIQLSYLCGTMAYLANKNNHDKTTYAEYINNSDKYASTAKEIYESTINPAATSSSTANVLLSKFKLQSCSTTDLEMQNVNVINQYKANIILHINPISAGLLKIERKTPEQIKKYRALESIKEIILDSTLSESELLNMMECYLIPHDNSEMAALASNDESWFSTNKHSKSFIKLIKLTLALRNTLESNNNRLLDKPEKYKLLTAPYITNSNNQDHILPSYN